MPSYPHTLVITAEAAGGKQDPAGGGHTPGAPSTIYSGGADVQDHGERWKQDDEGREIVDADVDAFLEVETAIENVQPKQLALATFEDATQRRGRVVGKRRLDGVVFIRWERDA